MAEAALLLWLAPAARALAPQVTALGPLAVFHDLRWLYGYGGSWAGFILMLAALAVARTLTGAGLVRLAWPRGVAPPRLRLLLGCGLAAVLLSGVLLSPLVTMTFGVALLPFSWPLLATLPALLLIVTLLSHAGAAPWWWRILPPARAVGWAITDFLALSAAAALTGWLPHGWAIPVAGLAGLVNARAWYGVTRALALPRREFRRVRRPALARSGAPAASGAPEVPGAPGLPRTPGVPGRGGRPLPRPLPLAPLAVVMAVILVVGVVRLAFSAGQGSGHAAAAAVQQPGPAPGPDQHGARAGGPGIPVDRTAGSAVLEVRGFGSTCCANPAALADLDPGGVVQQFSYRGLSPAGHPLPYGRSASNLPLAELGDRIADQVQHLHQRTGRPVDVVAESEGTLGLYAMLARHKHVPLGSVVLLSPIVAPGQVSYPADGGPDPDGDRGLVPGYELRAMVGFIGSLSPYGSSGAQTLISSVNKSGAHFAGAAAEVARHSPFRWLVVLPLADALTLPACALPTRAVVVPALHGGLATDPVVAPIISSFLAGQQVRTQSGLQEVAETMAAAATAWRMPENVSPSPPCVPGHEQPGR
ncbi:MAG TPA: hypothetical protein VFV41_15860 [Streptosporangiaceae bacterium]|nr:hypothetical protein [Streptosporangiaceae bacterium]